MYWLKEKEIAFPEVEFADRHGLLAGGGDLTAERLVFAYQMGIFPWYNEGEPILWWSPDPRFVVKPKEVYESKSMRKILNRKTFDVTIDTAFEQVIANCAHMPRGGQDGTWITQDMIDAYSRLHQLGIAHSVEVWQDNELVGGLYGLSLGKLFFGESMFTKVSNASKVGFITLARLLDKKGFELIDCQTESAHLRSLGADFINRKDFCNNLDKQDWSTSIIGSWTDWLGNRRQ